MRFEELTHIVVGSENGKMWKNGTLSKKQKDEKKKWNEEGHKLLKNKEKYHFSQNKISVNVLKRKCIFYWQQMVLDGVGKFSYKNNKEIICSYMGTRAVKATSICIQNDVKSCRVTVKMSVHFFFLNSETMFYVNVLNYHTFSKERICEFLHVAIR